MIFVAFFNFKIIFFLSYVLNFFNFILFSIVCENLFFNAIFIFTNYFFIFTNAILIKKIFRVFFHL